MENYIIQTVTPKKFISKETGDEVMYFWYNALRGDGVVLQFGSTREYTEGERIQAEIIRTINSKGKPFFKELV